MNMPTRKILLAADVQRDFIDGTIAVPGAERIIPAINGIKKGFDLVCFTLDWHAKDHCSFKENGGIWPEHRVLETLKNVSHLGREIGFRVNVFLKGTAGFDSTPPTDWMRENDVKEY